jgi:sigma-B regulation protein RsbU (phosphoserine phosphatase)
MIAFNARKKHNHSIYSKVRLKTLNAALISAFTIFIVATIAIFIIRANVADISDQLGRQASVDSASGITELAFSSLSNMAETHASLCDYELKTISDAVSLVANQTTYIMQHSEDYKEQYNVLPPDPKNDGKMVAQVLYAPDTNPSEVKSELGLLGNLVDVEISVLKSIGDFGMIQIGTESGMSILVENISSNKTVAFDPRTRPWYTEAKDEGTLIWTEVFDDVFGGGLVMTCATPYYGKNNKFLGVVGAGAYLTALNDIVTGTVSIGTNGTTRSAFIVDEKCNVIISNDIEKNSEGEIISENLLESPDTNVRKAGKNMLEQKGGIERVTVDGRDYFMAYSPMTVRPWTFCVLVDTADILSVADTTKNHIDNFTAKALSNIQKIFIVILIIFASLLVFISFAEIRISKKLATDLTNPIITLTENVRHMKSSNDFFENLHIDSGDEIEELSDAFMEMTLRIKNYIENITTITAEKERIGTELAVATSIQSSMLPCIFPPFPGRFEFDIYATMIPAKEVGGDFYDFFLINKDTLCIVVADVSGKGIPAALYMVITKTLLKNNAQAGMKPADVFEKVNNLLCENNEADMFVTSFMGYLDIPSGRFTFVNAGHNPPLIKQGDSFRPLEVKPGFILAGMENTKFTEDEVTLSSGDALFLYTDGAVEAVNVNLELFGMKRLLDVANRESLDNLDKFTLGIKAAIDDFSLGEEQFDDITLLSFRYDGAGSKSVKDDNSPRHFDELDILADVNNLDTVLKYISNPLRENGHPEPLIKQIEIAAEEVFVNIAKYAYPPVHGNAKISLSIENDIIIIFSDAGKPFDPLESEDPDITLSVEDRIIGGLGIFMTKQIMGKVSYRYEEGRNILTLQKNLYQG